MAGVRPSQLGVRTALVDAADGSTPPAGLGAARSGQTTETGIPPQLSSHREKAELSGWSLPPFGPRGKHEMRGRNVPLPSRPFPDGGRR